MSDTVQQARLRSLIEAEKKVLTAQEWQNGTIKNRRADYQQIRKAIDELRSAGVMLPEETAGTAQSATGARTKRIILLD
jgi:hypothetical protein